MNKENAPSGYVKAVKRAFRDEKLGFLPGSLGWPHGIGDPVGVVDSGIGQSDYWTLSIGSWDSINQGGPPLIRVRLEAEEGGDPSWELDFIKPNGEVGGPTMKNAHNLTLKQSERLAYFAVRETFYYTAIQNMTRRALAKVGQPATIPLFPFVETRMDASGSSANFTLLGGHDRIEASSSPNGGHVIILLSGQDVRLSLPRIKGLSDYDSYQVVGWVRQYCQAMFDAQKEVPRPRALTVLRSFMPE